MQMTTTDRDDLTERQREVLRLHEEGKTPTEIGQTLGITSQNVHGHFKRLRRRGLMGPAGGPRAAQSDILADIRRVLQEKERDVDARLREIATSIQALETEREALVATRAQIEAMVSGSGSREPVAA